MNLLQKISDPQHLLKSWSALNKNNPESHGVSGLTIEQFKSNLDERISSLSAKLRAGKFNFSPTRAVAIKKSNGTFRPLQIPEIQDRLVLKAIAIELESKFEKTLKQSDGISFAYQKGLGVKDAIEKMVSYYDSGYKVVVEADIIDFFGSVNKDSLLSEKVFPLLGNDSSINDLIKNGLCQKVGGLTNLSDEEANAFKDIDKGIPQGNALSPLFSNLYLSPFDVYMKDKNYKMVRYADDFIVMVKTQEQAIECFNNAQAYLESELKLGLYNLDTDKSKIVEPNIDEFSFLSIRFDGKKYYPSKQNFEKLKNKIRSVCNIPIQDINLLQLLTKLKNRVEGWLSAFHFTDVDRYIEQLEYFINRQLFLSIRKFEWRLTKSSLGKVPNKYVLKTDKTRDCLSIEQRKYSGIPECSEILESIRKNQTIHNNS